MTEADNWIPAIEAVALLAGRLGDRAAKETLISRLEDGRLSLAAQLVIQEADLGEPLLAPESWRSEKYFRAFPRQADRNYVLIGENDTGLVELRKDIFAREQGWLFDTDRFVWSQGILFAKRPATFRSRLKLKRKVVVGKLGSTIIQPSQAPKNGSLRLVSLGIHFPEYEVTSILTVHPAMDARSGTMESQSAGSEEEHLADDDRPICEELAAMIETGEFQEAFGLPRRGLKAKIAKEIDQRMTRRELYPPSKKTLLRRAEELIDQYAEEIAKKGH